MTAGGDRRRRGSGIPDRFAAHVAMQEADENRQVVTWLEHVNDDQPFGSSVLVRALRFD